MIGSSANDSNFGAVLWIPTSVCIHNVQMIPSIEIVNCTLAIDLENVVINIDVDRTPPNIIFGVLVADNSFVRRRTSSLGTGIRNQGSRIRDDGAFIKKNGFLVKSCWRKVASNIFDLDAILIEVQHRAPSQFGGLCIHKLEIAIKPFISCYGFTMNPRKVHRGSRSIQPEKQLSAPRPMHDGNNLSFWLNRRG